MRTLLAFTSVGKRFRSKTAITDLTFSVQAGQAIGLVGPEGAGKTTTLRLAQGALRPNTGQVRLAGYPPLELPTPECKVGFVFGGTGLPKSQTVEGHLTALHLTTGLPPYRLNELVTEFGLGPLLPQRIRRLGEAERLRVSLATAMAFRPRLLVLDEPLRNLDLQAAHWLRQVLLRHVSDGGALLISGTELVDVERVVDSVVVINQQQLYSGPIADLRSPQCPTLAQAYLRLIKPQRAAA
ncbi:Lipopolysaccharide export system ATP-binding protein LptB [Actinomyces bovis]|uniref:Lipopolysaccharide export system ATP-binding protein LptB n=1 Tax=Actinomyces bovis TaxID=1658 RepID=A0ABY1VQN2_9ACTO|nr:ABC transporter ATP-binding protein [Actinomyces bovis]SPT54434.1 Lipopolysaccharide export system ATP-binding protein LptB [Actinomyces bovis]VEG55970.1 Lipopolysaccharide export system ATP-binding protein LptB [Actinomyces israelii]